MTSNWRTLLIIPALLILMVVIGRSITDQPFFPIAIVASVIVAIVTFRNPENGLLVIIFSMLLSPEITIGKISGGNMPGRDIGIRVDDILIIVVFIAWLAHIAMDKEWKGFLKTPFDKLMLFLTALYIASTSIGVIAEYTSFLKASLFTLKYIEFFIIYWMVVNITRNRETIKNYLTAGVITWVIVTIYAYTLIPSGMKTHAPFDSQVGGEPASLGGYYIIIFALLFSFFLHAETFIKKAVAIAGIIFLLTPFIKTLSRASYLAFIPMVLTILLMTKKGKAKFGLILLIGAILSPLLFPTMTAETIDRIQYTFTGSHNVGYESLSVGDTKISDQSALERVFSWKRTMNEYFPRTILTMLIGNGITGIRFTEGQFFLLIGELGIFGVIAFYLLQYRIFKISYKLYNMTVDNMAKTISLAMMASIIGLSFHAITTNSYIIVRIMEPFWFLVGLVAILYEMTKEKLENPKLASS